METFFEKHDLFLEERPRLPKSLVKKILGTEPAFVWAPTTPSRLPFFSEWQARGERFEPISLACDIDTYHPAPEDQRFKEVELAFVGGFRAYKNLQYEKYLRPWESRLTVFGIGEPWPYSGYRKSLELSSEKVLYQNATLCPALSEPHAQFTGDIVERIFKVLGCGGLPIADVVPSYRELFREGEILLPGSLEEYHEMTRTVLEDPDLQTQLRKKGHAALLTRHTYEHRARQILDILQIKNQIVP
jgi:spore maturation protein CgeB